jgi:hypothetical protein
MNTHGNGGDRDMDLDIGTFLNFDSAGESNADTQYHMVGGNAHKTQDFMEWTIDNGFGDIFDAYDETGASVFQQSRESNEPVVIHNEMFDRPTSPSMELFSRKNKTTKNVQTTPQKRSNDDMNGEGVVKKSKPSGRVYAPTIFDPQNQHQQYYKEIVSAFNDGTENELFKKVWGPLQNSSTIDNQVSKPINTVTHPEVSRLMAIPATPKSKQPNPEKITRKRGRQPKVVAKDVNSPGSVSSEITFETMNTFQGGVGTTLNGMSNVPLPIYQRTPEYIKMMMGGHANLVQMPPSIVGTFAPRQFDWPPSPQFVAKMEEIIEQKVKDAMAVFMETIRTQNMDTVSPKDPPGQSPVVVEKEPSNVPTTQVNDVVTHEQPIPEVELVVEESPPTQTIVEEQEGEVVVGDPSTESHSESIKTVDATKIPEKSQVLRIVQIELELITRTVCKDKRITTEMKSWLWVGGLRSFFTCVVEHIVEEKISRGYTELTTKTILEKILDESEYIMCDTTQKQLLKILKREGLYKI